MTRTTVTLSLTDREIELLGYVFGLDVEVPKAVVNSSFLHAEERGAGAKRADQKEELADVLSNIGNQLHESRMVVIDAKRQAARRTKRAEAAGRELERERRTL
jgi:hypothetical protein